MNTNNNNNNKQPNFGDFVRSQLNIKNSPLSLRVKFFKNFCYLMKRNPKIYSFYWQYSCPNYTFSNCDQIYPSYLIDEIRCFRPENN